MAVGGREAEVLRAAVSASGTDALDEAVNRLYPTEARRLVTKLERLLASAQRVAQLQDGVAGEAAPHERHPVLHAVVRSTYRREDAVARLNMLIEWARTGADAHPVIFEMDGMQLRRADLEVLAEEDGEILLLTHDENKAAELAREHDHASVTSVVLDR